MKKKMLSLHLWGGQVQIPMWENSEATVENKQPNFRGAGVVAWLNEYDVGEETTKKGGNPSSSHSSEVVEEKIFEE